MEKRNRKITVRFTDKELLLAKENSSGRLAVWLRNLSLNQKPKKKAKPVNAELLFELNKIGVNVNQIAKTLNSSNASVIDRAKTLLVMADISSQLEALRDKYDR